MCGYKLMRNAEEKEVLTCEVALYGYPNCEKDIAASFVTISNIPQPLIDCNQFYFKSTVLHTFPRTAFRSIIHDFTHRRETLGWHQLQIVLYE